MPYHENPRTAPRESQPSGEISSGEYRATLCGRALQLALWIARHQCRINDTSPDGGQLVLNWKGMHPSSIVGEIKTRL